MTAERCRQRAEQVGPCPGRLAGCLPAPRPGLLLPCWLPSDESLFGWLAGWLAGGCCLVVVVR